MTSSLGDHGPCLICGLRSFRYLSRHCLPVRGLILAPMVGLIYMCHLKYYTILRHGHEQLTSIHKNHIVVLIRRAFYLLSSSKASYAVTVMKTVTGMTLVSWVVMHYHPGDKSRPYRSSHRRLSMTSSQFLISVQRIINLQYINEWLTSSQFQQVVDLKQKAVVLQLRPTPKKRRTCELVDIAQNTIYSS
jgi:hypothetical protein